MRGGRNIEIQRKVSGIRKRKAIVVAKEFDSGRVSIRNDKACQKI